MEIASRLWAAGIKAEFGFKPNPKMGDQLNHAFESGIPFIVLFGGDELANGVVKVKVSRLVTKVPMCWDIGSGPLILGSVSPLVKAFPSLSCWVVLVGSSSITDQRDATRAMVMR